jgi:hypothetical protein
MRRPSAPIALFAVSALLAAGALLSWMAQPAEEVGSSAEIVASLGFTSTTALGVPDTTATTAARLPTVAPNDINRLDALANRSLPPPVRLVIPALDVDAPVDPYGVNERTGQMAVPRNVTDVAWYEHGPVPGEPGSAVLAAHVDLAGRGPGVFFGLRWLEPGDEMVVEHADGSATRFVVVARTLYAKDELPLDAIFSTAGDPVLTLVTCGGGFDPSRQTYDGNVVVYAVPAPPVPDPQL